MKEILFGNGAKYIGELKDGKFEGKGTYTFPDGSIYNGNFKEDKVQGYGILTYPNGKKYEGEFKEGKFSGNGTLTYPDGTIHIGEFEDDKFNGKGKVIYPDGAIYEGIFKDGKREKGVFKNINNDDKNSVIKIVNLTFSNGDTYVGGYKDEKYYGKGTYTYADGTTYSGEYMDGLREGEGILTYSNGNKYEGGFKEGKKCGKGIYTFLDGTIYVGEYKDGLRNGKGILTDSNGNKYEGEYKDGLKNGKGILTYSHGEKYEGEFKEGKLNGKGIYTFSDGTIYVGEFKNGVYNGKGILTYSNSNKYEGGFKEGKKCGKGIYTFLDGTIYVGEFKNGVYNGEGILTFSNGERYEGGFKQGDFCGKGTYKYLDGAIYIGDFKNGKLCGKGTYTFSDGTIYIGEFKDGLRNGQGIQASPNGDKYEGEFKEEEFCGKGIFKKTNGEIYNGDFKNGKYNGIGSLINCFDEKYNGEFVDGKYNGIGTLISTNGKKYSGEFKDGRFVPKDTNSINYKINDIKQEVYFKNIQRKISELLDGAEFEVKIAVAWFTDEYLINKLKKLAKEGVIVTIIIYDDGINKKDLFKDLYLLNSRIYLSSKLMHNKFCVIDNNIVINGSYNWTRSAHSNDENITVTYNNREFKEKFIEEFNNLKLNCRKINSHFVDYFDSANIVEQLIKKKIEVIKEKKRHYNSFYPFFYKKQNGVFFVKDDNIFKRLILLYELEKMVDLDGLNKKLKDEIRRENNNFYEWYCKEKEDGILYYDIADVEFDDDNMSPFTSKDKHLAIKKYYQNHFKVFFIDINNKESYNKTVFNLRINEFFVYVKDVVYSDRTRGEIYSFYSKELKFIFEINKNGYKILESIILLNKKSYNGQLYYNIVDFNGKKINEIDYYSYVIKEKSIELKYLPDTKFSLLKGKAVSEYYGNDYRIDTYNFYGKILSKEYVFDKKNRYENLIVNVYDDDLALFEKKYGYLKKEDFNMTDYRYFLELLTIYNYMSLGDDTFMIVLDKNSISLLKYVENEIKNDKKLFSIAASSKIKIKKEKEPFCYIATMAYGDINHPKVQDFRNFRDNYLSKTILGNVFINYYYKHSPNWVKVLEPHKTINKVIRLCLDILNYFIPKKVK